MRLRQETQLAVQRRSWTSTYTTTLRLYPNTTSNEPSVHQSKTYNGDTSYPIISYHHISIASRANKKWSSSHNRDINQSAQHERINTWSQQWLVPELTAVQPITTPTCRLHWRSASKRCTAWNVHICTQLSYTACRSSGVRSIREQQLGRLNI